MKLRFWAALFLLVTGLHAATPQVGERAPAFALQTLEEKTFTLDSLTQSGPVVLIVLRGYPGYQCPFCLRQVPDFTARAKDFAAKGARVVMVYPGPVEDLKLRAHEFKDGKQWPDDFVFLIDPGYRFTNTYGLRWDAKNETAYPSTFIIGRDGKVTWEKISKAHDGRSTAAEVLEKL